MLGISPAFLSWFSHTTIFNKGWEVYQGTSPLPNYDHLPTEGFIVKPWWWKRSSSDLVQPAFHVIYVNINWAHLTLLYLPQAKSYHNGSTTLSDRSFKVVLRNRILRNKWWFPLCPRNNVPYSKDSNFCKPYRSHKLSRGANGCLKKLEIPLRNIKLLISYLCNQLKAQVARRPWFELAITKGWSEGCYGGCENESNVGGTMTQWEESFSKLLCFAIVIVFGWVGQDTLLWQAWIF